MIGKFNAGMNSGVMLFRKSEWSLKFLQAIADLGRIPEPKLGEVCYYTLLLNYKEHHDIATTLHFEICLRDNCHVLTGRLKDI